MKKNKIILFVLALILLAGIIMICVKGFNVSLDLRAHDTLKFVFNQKFNENDITKICDEVFKDKEYEIKIVEVFSDAIYIISPTINENEEKQLLEKLNDLYVVKEDSQEELENIDNVENVENTEEQEVVEESILDKLEVGSKYALYHDSKVRILDIVKPYIFPSIVSILIVVIYIIIKYRKLNDGKVLVTACKTLGEMLFLVVELLAIIAIFRIAFIRPLIPIMIFIVVVYLCIKLQMFENQLKRLEE